MAHDRPDPAHDGLPTPDVVDHVFGGAPPGGDPELRLLAAVALHAARRAADVLVEGARLGPRAVETKSTGTDMVSEVDRGAEAVVGAVLADHRPDDGLLGEEGAARDGTTGYRWVVDPLDGTTNFVFGIPQWSVSIAVERDGDPVVGIVLDPTRDETWAATLDGPACCNGTGVRVADGRSTLDTALVATGFGYASARRAWQAGVLTLVAPAVRDIRRFGSAALDLCWVGGARVDGYYEWGLNPWDLQAGRLVCRRAGGRADVLDGGLVVATTPSLWGPLTELLESAGALRPPVGAGA